MAYHWVEFRCVWVLLGLLLQSVRVVSQFVRTLSECTNSPGEEGYEQIEVINSDIAAEVEKIINGEKDPEGAYIFPLCSNTELEVTEPLRPQLDNTVFSCGDGTLGNGCQIFGGENQVIIDISPINTLPLQNVDFLGVTFSSFTVAAISGNADSTTTVELTRCEIVDFDSEFGVRQARADGSAPFTLNVVESEVRNAAGGSAFSNAGGILTLDNVNILNSELMSVVSSAHSDNGDSTASTILQNVDVANSTLSGVFVTMQGASTMAMDVTVRNMLALDTVFEVSGQGSTAALQRVTIRDNNFNGGVEDDFWAGVVTREGGTATVLGSSFTDNNFVLKLFFSDSNSRIELNDVTINNIAGIVQVNPAAVSAIMLAREGSELVSANVGIAGTSSFTAVYFASSESNLDVRQSCVESGESQAAIYVDESSTVTGNDNFIDPGFGTNEFVCPREDAPGYLVKETPGSSCFEAGGNCAFECMDFFDAAACLRQATIQPNYVPTIAPSISSNPTPTAGADTRIPSMSLFPTAPGDNTEAPGPSEEDGSAAPSSGDNTEAPGGTALPTAEMTAFSTGPPGLDGSTAPSPSGVDRSTAPSTGENTEAPGSPGVGFLSFFRFLIALFITCNK